MLGRSLYDDIQKKWRHIQPVAINRDWRSLILNGSQRSRGRVWYVGIEDSFNERKELLTKLAVEGYAGIAAFDSDNGDRPGGR